MATGDQIIARLTPRAEEINLDVFTANSQNPGANAQMPAIRYFVPTYNRDVVMKDAAGGFQGVKTPWFSDVYPDETDESEYYNYDPLKLDNIDGVAEAFNDLPAAAGYEEATEMVNALKYRDSEGSIKILLCDIKENQGLASVNPNKITAALEKPHNKYDHQYLKNDGSVLEMPQANVLYILDEEYNVVAVVHAYGFTFALHDEWTIMQTIAYPRTAFIPSVPANDDPFVQTAAEVVLPEIVIGKLEDLLSKKASHNMSDFMGLSDADISDQRATFLETAGALENNAVRGGDNIHFNMENQSAALNLNGHSLELSGNGLRGYLRVNAASGSLVISGADVDMSLDVDGFGPGGLTVSGDKAALRLNVSGSSAGALVISGSGVNIKASADNPNVLDFQSAAGICRINGETYGRAGATLNHAVNIGGKITATELNLARTQQGASGALKINGQGIIDADGNINGADIQSAADISAGGAVGGGSFKIGETTVINSQRHIAASEVAAAQDLTVNGNAAINDELTTQGGLTGDDDGKLNLKGDSLVNCPTITILESNSRVDTAESDRRPGDWEVTGNLTVGGVINANALNAQNISDGELSIDGFLPEIIVGSPEDKADNTVVSVLSDLVAQDLSGKRVLFLTGTEALGDNFAINGDDIRFEMEKTAVLDLNGKSLTLNGNRLRGHLNIIDSSEEKTGETRLLGREIGLSLHLTGVAAGSLKVLGKNVNLNIVSYSNNKTRVNEALDFQGTGVCAVNGPRIQNQDDAVGEEIIIGGNSDLTGGRADHDINQCTADSPDLTGNRVRLLKTIGALTSDSALSGDNINFIMEHEDAFLNLSGHSLTLSGDNLSGFLNIDNAADGSELIYDNSPDLTVNPTTPSTP